MRRKLLYIGAFALLLLRPSYVQHLFPIGAEIIYSFGLACIGTALVLRGKVYVTRPKIIFYFFILLYCAYTVVQSYVTGNVISAAVNDSLYIIGIIVLTLAVKAEEWDVLLRVIVFSVLIVVPSYLITTIFIVFVGIDGVLIRELFITIETGGYDALLCFPYSLYIGGVQPVLGVTLPRAAGLMREPGIFQIPVIISYFAVDFLDMNYKKILKLTFASMVLLTISTAGFMSFLASLIYYNFFVKRDLKGSTVEIIGRNVAVLFVLAPLVYWGLFQDTYIGLLNKLESGSGTARVLSAISALNVFTNHPLFGIGYVNDQVNAIHFLGAMAQIGLAGILLLGFSIFGAIWRLVRERHPITVILVPLLLTVLFSQPIYRSPFFFFIVGLLVVFTSSKDRDRLKTIGGGLL
ncbi:hypothetical protein GGQ02_002488 [Salinibacter ruber]|uniref:O-antigen ligase family protein n=1 Tax=Salinibacter ruber TaxID=146919 RepID=UPI002168EB5F|nr:O-antigen ligase family protein [Salinibacter ruber]MCS4034088.1 hypothetical protein [Salinibacter ruber]